MKNFFIYAISLFSLFLVGCEKDLPVPIDIKDVSETNLKRVDECNTSSWDLSCWEVDHTRTFTISVPSGASAVWTLTQNNGVFAFVGGNTGSSVTVLALGNGSAKLNVSVTGKGYACASCEDICAEHPPCYYAECDNIEVRPINPGYPEGTLCVSNIGKATVFPLGYDVRWVIQPITGSINDFNVFHPHTMPDAVTIQLDGVSSILDFSVTGVGSWTVVAQILGCEGEVVESCGTTITAVSCSGGGGF